MRRSVLDCSTRRYPFPLVSGGSACFNRRCMSEESFLVAACEHCGQHIEFPSHALGVRVPCPHCAIDTILGQPSSNPTPDLSEIGAAELKAAMEGTVPRRRISIFYQVGLLLVALFMVLLPLAYFAFAAFIAYCVYWYAVHARVLFSSFVGGAYVFMLKALLYIGPLIGGAIAV